MKFLQIIIRKWISKELPKPLGRWNNEYCDTKINKKIDFSNEDHCGPCGQYLLDKTKLKSEENINSESNIVKGFK